MRRFVRHRVSDLKEGRCGLVRRRAREQRRHACLQRFITSGCASLARKHVQAYLPSTALRARDPGATLGAPCCRHIAALLRCCCILFGQLQSTCLQTRTERDTAGAPNGLAYEALLPESMLQQAAGIGRHPGLHCQRCGGRHARRRRTAGRPGCRRPRRRTPRARWRCAASGRRSGSHPSRQSPCCRQPAASARIRILLKGAAGVQRVRRPSPR